MQGSQFSNTNQLYKPLRETLQHPEIVRQHANLTPVLVQGSRVSKDYRRLNEYELQNIVNTCSFRKGTSTFQMEN